MCFICVVIESVVYNKVDKQGPCGNNDVELTQLVRSVVWFVLYMHVSNKQQLQQEGESCAVVFGLPSPPLHSPAKTTEKFLIMRFGVAPGGAVIAAPGVLPAVFYFSVVHVFVSRCVCAKYQLKRSVVGAPF